MNKTMKPAEIRKYIRERFARESFDIPVEVYDKSNPLHQACYVFDKEETQIFIGTPSKGKYASTAYYFYKRKELRLSTLSLSLGKDRPELDRLKNRISSLWFSSYSNDLQNSADTERYIVWNIDLWLHDIRSFYIPFSQKINTLRDWFEYKKIEWTFKLYEGLNYFNYYAEIYYWMQIFQPELCPIVDYYYEKKVAKSLEEYEVAEKDAHFIEQKLLDIQSMYDEGKTDHTRSSLISEGILRESDFELSGPVADLRSLRFQIDRASRDKDVIDAYDQIYWDFVEKYPAYYTV